MKTYFEIIPAYFYEDECSLVCEVSHEGISCAVKNDKEQKYIGVGVYHFDKSRPKIGLPVALQILFNSRPFFEKKYKKVTVVYSVAESVLIPFQLYNSNTAPDALNLLFGDLHARDEICTDVITESSYYNCFRVSRQVFDIMHHQFPSAVQWHQYSMLLGSHRLPGDKMSVIFYTYKMVVSVYKEGKCLLVNSYPYQGAHDISYYLLSIREALKVEDIPLEVAGFIEQDSSLYQELYKYFLNISFMNLPEFCEYSDDILQYPDHYFSHLFSADTCG